MQLANCFPTLRKRRRHFGKTNDGNILPINPSVNGKENMMKKSFHIDNLDCANCAAKMERAIAKIDGVNHVSVNFIMARLTLEAEDGIFDEVLKKAEAKCRAVDADCKIRF